jgi:hypothetical protein
MTIPFVIDNQQHRLADALKELLGQSAGKPLDIATAYFAISGYWRSGAEDRPDDFTMKAKEDQP